MSGMISLSPKALSRDFEKFTGTTPDISFDFIVTKTLEYLIKKHNLQCVDNWYIEYVDEHKVVIVIENEFSDNENDKTFEKSVNKLKELYEGKCIPYSTLHY